MSTETRTEKTAQEIAAEMLAAKENDLRSNLLKSFSAYFSFKDENNKVTITEENKAIADFLADTLPHTLTTVYSRIIEKRGNMQFVSPADYRTEQEQEDLDFFNDAPERTKKALESNSDYMEVINAIRAKKPVTVSDEFKNSFATQTREFKNYLMAVIASKLFAVPMSSDWRFAGQRGRQAK